MTASRKDVRSYAEPLIRRIIDACPPRVAGSESERRAHEMLHEEFESVGMETEFHEFRYNRSLYANLALHFGLALVGSALFFVQPWLAFVVHLLVAVSYWGDTTKRFLLLRRLFPFYESQNLIGRLPAGTELRRRVVLVAHADAAFTGLLFHPWLIERTSGKPPEPFGFIHRSLLVTTVSVLLLAGVDLGSAVGLVSNSPALLAVVVGILSVPALVATLLNLDVVIRNRVVPGANDNLTGCAGAVVLAERLAPRKPDDVELVFVATGAEEASTGGALALAREMADDEWSPDDTVILGIDTLSNGELTYLVEGEISQPPIPDGLADAIEAVNRQRADLDDVRPFEVPVGATDVLPFRMQGFPGVCLSCVDRDLGAPRHYHWPTDTPDNLDLEQYEASLAFTESLVDELMDTEAGS